MIQTEENKINNAIDFIKASTIYKDKRYLWIRPVIDKVLDNTISDSDIISLVSCIIPENNNEQENVDNNCEIIEYSKEFDSSQENNVKKILCISNISNIGLLNSKEPVDLKDGLNIFYGNNGAGKSSIYFAICKVLGKNKKRVFPNINSEDLKSSCEIKIINLQNQEIKKEWQTGQENIEMDAMIFDSDVCNYIIEDDQINLFKMAHLKTEYFAFLHELYQKIEIILNDKLVDLKQKYGANTLLLQKQAPFIFADSYTLDKQIIEKYIFSDEEKQLMKSAEKEKEILSKNSPEETVKNISHAVEKIELILDNFSVVEKNEEGEDVIVFKFNKYYFENVNRKIESYKSARDAFENKNNTYNTLPKEWIKQDLWIDFITKSIDFVNSLEEKVKGEFLTDKCVYCQQPLEADDAKKLIAAYQEIRKDQADTINSELRSIESIRNSISNCINFLTGVAEINKQIEAEFVVVGLQHETGTNFVKIKGILENIQINLMSLDNIEIDDTDLKLIENFWKKYKRYLKVFNEKIIKLKDLIKNKEDKMRVLSDSILTFSEKLKIEENKDNILEKFKYEEDIRIVEDRLNQIKILKQTTSSYESKFSQIAKIKTFKKFLIKEYENLGFPYPKEKWEIKSVTNAGINKRVYNLGDRKLSEIFSEGERKIHALADFFASCEVDDYKGVFIFDDPVNSLDENYIDLVAKRILKLVENGRQVIVFTHNIVFLNLLLDPSYEKITRVAKQGSEIFIERNTSIDTVDNLKVKFKIIDSKTKELLKKEGAKEKIDEYEIRCIYDLVSGYLEEYVEKKILSSIITRYRPNIRMGSIEKLNEIDKGLIEKLTNLYSKASRYGTRHSQPSQILQPDINKFKIDYEEFTNNFCKLN